jgi:hypothetical protein
VRAPKQHKAQRRKQKKDFGEFCHLESGPMRNSIYSTIIPYFFFSFKRASFVIFSGGNFVTANSNAGWTFVTIKDRVTKRDL